MATENCKVCGEASTPWTYIKELNGHICCYCDSLWWIFERNFDKYLQSIQNSEDSDGDLIKHMLRPRAIKRATYALIRKWCDQQNSGRELGPEE